MTHHEIQTLPDGTRRYSNNTKYRPVPPELRKRAVRKPADPRAVMFNKEWFVPFDTLPDGERVAPETRADSDAYIHMSTRPYCKCKVCRRPQAKDYQRRWTADMIRLGEIPDPTVPRR